ncbi:LOW QUALITY PROTEIN: tubulin folding cofactor E like protein mlt [Arctopsyche grandis]|uniref:LOW QUALITY PROTEIN: tubulin folding cofactor E like protein mlt n=1 Tax=Arctopsyche grandis TaxID=121162 RepID=UPI00406D64FD
MPSLVEALEKKYGWHIPATGADRHHCTDTSIAIFVPKRPPRLSVPTLLVLNDCDIETAGDGDQLDDKCSDVEELDLAKNKLSKWAEVFGILQHMPQVRFVNLSFNRLTEQLDALNKHAAHNTCWSHLKNLVLNSTRVDWASVQTLLRLLPALEELHLSLNEYDHVNLNKRESEHGLGEWFVQRPRERKVSGVYHQVKKLHFSGNPVNSWSEICKLGYAFPNLESLVLNECPLNSLDLNMDTSERDYKHPESTESTESPHHYFRKLRFLNLNNTELSTWDEIDRLANFPALTSLRVQGWPLWEKCESTEHERRQLLVARLPLIETLNGGGRLGAVEREDAERAFIRYYMERPESDRPERYSELLAIHGKLDPLVNVDLRPEKRVKVTFTCGDVSEVRTVDVYRTVIDLKQKLERMAGIPSNKMRLFYVDQDIRDYQGPEEMKFPHKQLYSYNMRSGDEIIIDSKN